MKNKKYISTTITDYLKEDKITNELFFKELNGDTFYHQTKCEYVQNIIEHNFISEIHQGQARYTHGVYFLNHPNGNYGECTLSADIYGNFIDFTYDDFGDDWIRFRDSIEWNNYEDLTIKIRKEYPNVDGLLFNHLLVVWYPNKSIKNIKLYDKK